MNWSCSWFGGSDPVSDHMAQGIRFNKRQISVNDFCRCLTFHGFTPNSAAWTAVAMSRFFATGSDSESEESSSADEIAPKATGTTFNKQLVFSHSFTQTHCVPFFLSVFHDRFHVILLRALLLSDDEEDTKRVVRSAKDKRWESVCCVYAQGHLRRCV